MRLYGGGIDQNLRRRSSGGGQSVKQVRPDTLGGPALEAVVQRLARPVDRRGILPPAAGDQDMHDTADDPAIIDPGLATGVRRKMWFKPRKLRVGQPKTVSVQQRSPSGDLESQPCTLGNPFMGPSPKTSLPIWTLSPQSAFYQHIQQKLSPAQAGRGCGE